MDGLMVGTKLSRNLCQVLPVGLGTGHQASNVAILLLDGCKQRENLIPPVCGDYRRRTRSAKQFPQRIQIVVSAAQFLQVSANHLLKFGLSVWIAITIGEPLERPSVGYCRVGR